MPRQDCHLFAAHQWGKIVIYDLLEAGSTLMPWLPLLDKSLSILGYTILDFFESNQEDLAGAGKNRSW